MHLDMGFLGVSDVDIIGSIWCVGLFITALFTLALTLIKRGVGLRH